MLINRTALFFLTLAVAILLLHNVIPHSHHHSDLTGKIHPSHSHHQVGLKHDGAHHHHHDNTPGEDPQDNKKDLADILSIINHHSEGITYLSGQKNSQADIKQLSASAFIIPETFYLSEFILPPLLHISPAEFFECITFHPCTNALRGPPAIAV